jgi:hypothetical protein
VKRFIKSVHDATIPVLVIITVLVWGVVLGWMT